MLGVFLQYGSYSGSFRRGYTWLLMCLEATNRALDPVLQSMRRLRNVQGVATGPDVAEKLHMLLGRCDEKASLIVRKNAMVASVRMCCGCVLDSMLAHSQCQRYPRPPVRAMPTSTVATYPSFAQVIITCCVMRVLCSVLSPVWRASAGSHRAPHCSLSHLRFPFFWQSRSAANTRWPAGRRGHCWSVVSTP